MASLQGTAEGGGAQTLASPAEDKARVSDCQGQRLWAVLGSRGLGILTVGLGSSRCAIVGSTV